MQVTQSKQSRSIVCDACHEVVMCTDMTLIEGLVPDLICNTLFPPVLYLVQV